MRLSPRNRIRAEALERNIPCVVHFTLLANLPGIVKNGLLSRVELMADLGDGVPSAAHRIDGADAAVSVSVTAMNWRMFTAKRKANGNAPWVVLLLDPSILWTHPCRFLSLNAGTTEMRDHRGRVDGPWAFSQMFADEVRPPGFREPSYRESMKIPDCLTTRPEAEVQVFSSIRPPLILEAWVETTQQAHWVDDELAKIDGNRNRIVNIRPIAPRFTNGAEDWG